MLAGKHATTLWMVIGALLAVVTGCGSESELPERAAVTGTILYRGKPLARASISFTPEARSGRAATGKTDDQGNYELTTYEPGDGALVGQHQVSVSLTEGGTEVDMDLGRVVVTKALIPKKYSSPDSSGLTANVVAGQTNKIDFKLDEVVP